ncbi:two-partner secretion domain-containing protein [Anabaena azotica]|uniref:Filamentous hemagglutinin N-terminal domain-containing protein n=1 Tax=Anabaena azotica FACHB-119 TaxID=947527 RepID=A0ABR8DD13_9NOST|nr:filamentous hemagglutinin N-terminal domain-containing protein [Anabaena azotica]MBD2505019.1 filamentous hemagglutinin N-terminal domain-containing protein [Anabaena azotica FACHB-119]
MTTPSNAQVIPDATLQNNTTININGTTINIEGGTRLGNNLFHSLREFSVSTGSTVHFNNPIGIEAIITRITGGTVSNIDGLIRTNGTGNLFLINPSGIVFGPNARLDIGGSLFVTTADALEFADGSSFSAVNPKQPLLTVSIPIGLRFSSKSGSITVQGTGEGLTALNTGSTPIIRNSNPSGISANTGKTLSLIGGDINTVGATLSSAEGNINLVSINSGLVRFNSSGSSFNFDNTVSFKNINLSERSLVDTSGNQGGSINLFGNNVSINSGSALLIQNRDLSSGHINIQAREKVEISGISQSNNRFYTVVRTESLGSQRAGHLNISAKDLIIEGGGNLASRNYNSGDGGDITINVSDRLNIAGFSSFNSLIGSSIVTSTLSSATAGNITVTARRVTADNGGTIASLTRGQTGVSGNLTINASDSIELKDSISNSGINYAASAFTSATTGSGNAGTLEINTDRLTVQPKTSINTSTLSAGNAGTLRINARNLEVRGSINSSATRANQNQQSVFGAPPIPSGSPGEVSINSNSLNITDGGQIAVVNEGTGDAGVLSVRSNTISLVNQGAINATTTSGQGGDISLNSQNIRLNNSSISATAGGTGNGGNINIDTKSIILQNNSSITANAFEGNGGNITIDTQGFFISRNSFITASSERGIDGTVRVNSAQRNFIELSNLKIVDPPQVQRGCSATEEDLPVRLTITPNPGLPVNPTDMLTPMMPWIDENAPSTPLPQVESSNQEEQPISAQGSRRNPDGTISLTALPEEGQNFNSQPSTNPTSSCQFNISQQLD